MKEREKIIISGLVSLLLLIWIGFLFHNDPSFPGSSWGLLLGVVGAVLMLVPLLYLIIKRNKPLKKAVTRFVPMRTLLTWHIYAGVLGPVLVILHTGHRYESPIGIALTAMTLIVVLSGFIGRYIMSIIGRGIREKKDTLEKLRAEYDQTIADLASPSAGDSWVKPGLTRAFMLRLSAPLFERSSHSAEVRAIRITESIADVEYALRTHDRFKQVFSKWLKWHIAVSTFLYLLLALHVYSQFHYGLRWLS